MIAGVIGYDSIRKHLAACGYHTAEIREKYHPYGCVDRKLEDMPDEGRRINTMKNYKIAVAGTGDGDIIGTTKKRRVKSRLLAA